MPILTNADFTEEQRRLSVRDLAGISEKTYEGTAIDRKIQTGDNIALSLYGILDFTTLNQPKQYNFLTVSNLMSAVIILAGMQKREREQTQLEKLANDIVKADSGVSETQRKTYTAVSNVTRRGTFA